MVEADDAACENGYREEARPRGGRGGGRSRRICAVAHLPPNLELRKKKVFA